MARPPDPLVGDGLLLVAKPAGLTSHDVVGWCRRICGTRKVGHAGTLDPMATGLLLIGVNRGTRLLTFLVGCDKTYEATIRLGVSTVTDDAEGETIAAADASSLTDAAIAAAVAELTGDIEQVPSSVSAIKVDGRRAYARVRGGEDVVLAARPVRVGRFEVLGRRDARVDGRGVVDLDVVVDCSSGTYIRALARDVGAALGVGGHLTALRRTRVGAFDVSAAASLEGLEEARATAPEGSSGLPMLPLAEVATAVMAVRELDEEEARRLSNGVRLPSQTPGRSGPIAAIGPGRRLVAVVDERSEKVNVLVVLANPW